MPTTTALPQSRALTSAVAGDKGNATCRTACNTSVVKFAIDLHRPFHTSRHRSRDNILSVRTHLHFRPKTFLQIVA
jgi:hypothetical protein